jgi:hypothetical protein
MMEWSASQIDDLTWYQSEGPEFKSCVRHLPPILIKHSTCWASLIKRLFKPTREGKYYNIN